MPGWAEPLRPAWVTLALIYWGLALPDRVSVGTGWLLGMTLDVLRGSLLGQHAFALTLVAYIVARLHQQIRVYPLRQQLLVVLLLTFTSELLVLWLRAIVAAPGSGWSHWLAPFISTAIWPWVFIVLRTVRRQFRLR